MAALLRGRAFAAQSLLLLCAAPAPAAFEIRDSRLYKDGERFVVRGVVYSNTPIRRSWAETMTEAGCLYPRDFPLVKALGANTIRTLAKVVPDDRVFRGSLEDADLYWLAGFPLDRFYNPSQTLSPNSPQGRALREQILQEFSAHVSSWRGEPRLIAFVFGDEVADGYAKKFSGTAAHFYSLLREAAARVNQNAEAPVLVATAVAETAQVGVPQLGTTDATQPQLAFWLLNRLGTPPPSAAFPELRLRSGKPFVFSFGVDAFDQRRQIEDEDAQAAVAALQARAIREAAAAAAFPLLGGLWASLLDEWWRGSSNAAQHGTQGRPANSFADGFLNAAWLGLFRLQPSGLASLDNLRPRKAYFALAEQWGGAAFSEGAAAVGPTIEEAGVTALAGGGQSIAPGGLIRVRGQGFATEIRTASNGNLPFGLGTTSACVGNQAVPLFYAGSHEIRGQLPWDMPLGKNRVAVIRQGTVSNVAEAETVPFAPGIFDGGVVGAGRPCPVDENNGVPAGTYLEIYGSGLGPVDPPALTGQVPDRALPLPKPPQVLWGDYELPVLFAGLLPNFAGVYQVNAQLPSGAPRRSSNLRLVQGAQPSNVYPLRVTGQQDHPAFALSNPEPNTLVMQRGGPTQVSYLRIDGVNSFCDSVEFAFSGLPAGVIASASAGFPGQIVPVYVQAGPQAALARGAEAFLIGRSSPPGSVRRSFAVTVLPSLGNVRLRVISGGWLSGAPAASFKTEDHLLYETNAVGRGRGFNFLTVDAQTGLLGPVRTFDTWGSEEQVLAMQNFLLSLPAGVVVLGAIADDGWLLLAEETRRILRETLGSRAIDALGYQYSWAIITRKGAAEALAEEISAHEQVVLDRVLTFPFP